MITFKPYQQALSDTKETTKQELAGVHAAETKKRIELKIAELETARASAESTAQSMARQYPLHIDSLTKQLDEVALLSRNIEQLRQMCEQLFPPAA